MGLTRKIRNITEIYFFMVCNVYMSCQDVDGITSMNISNKSSILRFDGYYSDPTLNFFTLMELNQQTYHNWVEDIIVPNLWTVFPKSINQIIHLTNWAATNNYKIRASGYMHNWSPLTVTNKDVNSNIILVRTTKYMTKMEMISKHHESGTVKVQTGASMFTLMTFLEQEGYGFYTSPAPGDISVGGVIAIGGHGTGAPTTGEILQPGYTYGSFSNLVISFTAIVWDSNKEKYVAREFHRSETDAKVFLTNLGRTFLYDVTLLVGKNFNLRCVSRVDIPASELFAAPTTTSFSNNENSFESFLNLNGRVEVIWLPFTTHPWLKVWTMSSKIPPTSRQVSSPYNYPFSDILPIKISLLIVNIIKWTWYLAPIFSALEDSFINIGLKLTDSSDIWGPSKNLLLYVRSTTFKVTANGYAVITKRSNVQNIIHSVVKFFKILIEEYRYRGDFPINGPLEIRVTGIDNLKNIDILQAESPSLSIIRPIEGQPEFDTAVWFDIFSLLGTPLANSFFTEMEYYFLVTINDGINAVVRPEWSKGWGYTDKGPYTNMTVIREIIPKVYMTENFKGTARTLDKYDPLRVFSNEFLDRLML